MFVLGTQKSHKLCQPLPILIAPATPHATATPMLSSLWRAESRGTWRTRLPTNRAIELHETVHPARWCITFADLKHFRSEVHRVLQEGKTFEENFEASYGPSIYAVNEHYIKPVTAAAGKMSWALMMNPEGLDCDLFITHAWQEDVFEFTEKVLASWPWRARHAWCCMLANPQNLDIAALLQSPSSSPFALALQSSKYMLVVPNRHKSVYTRLWCGYEAYLAFQSNKIIRTAAPPIWRRVCFSWLRMLPALLIGGIIGLFAKMDHFQSALQLILLMKMLALLASLVSQNCGQIRLCLIANHLGLASAIATVAITGFFGSTVAIEASHQKKIFVFESFMTSLMVPWSHLRSPKGSHGVSKLSTQIGSRFSQILGWPISGSVVFDPSNRP